MKKELVLYKNKYHKLSVMVIAIINALRSQELNVFADKLEFEYHEIDNLKKEDNI